jgi:hypothetical protein
MEPYALYLLNRLRSGESVGQLVSTEGIARDRILVRLRVARRYERLCRNKAPTNVCDPSHPAAA